MLFSSSSSCFFFVLLFSLSIMFIIFHHHILLYLYKMPGISDMYRVKPSKTSKCNIFVTLLLSASLSLFPYCMLFIECIWNVMFMVVRACLLPSYRILHSNNQICEMLNLCTYYCRLPVAGNEHKIFHQLNVYVPLPAHRFFESSSPYETTWNGKFTKTIHRKQWILCCRN